MQRLRNEMLQACDVYGSFMIWQKDAWNEDKKCIQAQQAYYAIVIIVDSLQSQRPSCCVYAQLFIHVLWQSIHEAFKLQTRL